MKLKLVLSLALLAAALTNAAAQKTEFVGYEHKGVIYGRTLPNGVKDLGGSLLSIEDYGVSRFSKGGKIMLWLENIIDYDEDGIPTWRVKDVLTFPKLKKNQEFLFSYDANCWRDGKESPDLIVLAEFSPKRKIYLVERAWLANIDEEKFEKIPIKGIECRVVER